MQKPLTQTLVFQLKPNEEGKQLLHYGQLEARRVVNEIYRLDNEHYDWNTIEHIVQERSSHVKNTTQRLYDKATDDLELHYNEEDYGHPSQEHQDSYPIRMNYGEGYTLEINKETGDITYRVSALKGKLVRGTLHGSPQNLERLEDAMDTDGWRVGTAEVVNKYGRYELHVTVTHETAEVADKQDATTFIGVDVNEDCVGLAAVTESEVKDTIVIEYPEVKKERHEFFTIRKRMQDAGQSSLENEVQGCEKEFVHDQLHQVSRRVVNWVNKFENPVLVFEDLEDMRDSIDYGARMNRRLHSLPFAQLQDYVSYKAAWDGIPSDKVDPEYTSQECPNCGHTSQSNRHKKRFKCVECAWQDHSDRKAGVLISARGLEKQEKNVPALNNLPVVRTRKVRRRGNGECEPPDRNPFLTIRGNHTDGQTGSVSNQSAGKRHEA